MARVHHLDCGTMCPRGRRLVNGDGGLLAVGKMVCHCLLVESDSGLVLVDSGIGLEDMADGGRRLGFTLRAFVRPVLEPELTAARQVERLGHKRTDVRHVVLTHLDFDHASGICDFRDATIHVLAREHDAAMRPSRLLDRVRYHKVHWAHGPKWALRATEPEGEKWFGFEAVRAIDGLDSILMVPTPGHTFGHAAIAVRDESRWLLHCGDAYFNRGEVAEPPSCPSGLSVFQRVLQISSEVRLGNQARIRALARDHASEVSVFSAHDPVELERFARSPAPKTPEVEQVKK